MSDAAPPGERRLMLQVFIVGLVSLFVELLVIRWLGTEIALFAYIQNLVLVACFLGLGAGGLTAATPFRLSSVVLPLLTLLGLFAIPDVRRQFASVGALVALSGDVDAWAAAFRDSATRNIVAWRVFLTYVVLFLVCVAFVPLGRLAARLLDDCPRPFLAYSSNVAGSLAGIWIFSLLCMLSLPPQAWIAIGSAFLGWLAWSTGQDRTRSAAWLLALAVVGALGTRDPGATAVFWSPYQKLSIRPPAGSGAQWSAIGDEIIWVNTGPYQAMIDLRPERLRADPVRYPPSKVGWSQYDLPARMHPRPRKALVVGAGSGNDVAGLLRHGVEEVVAVDIDPVIVRLGRERHPEKPYDDPRVRVVVDDARSYFLGTKERFDLIVFGLLDSHSTTSMSSTRLDHYVYTRQSLEQARSLLAPGGVLVLSFEPNLKRFVPERLLVTLRDAFGHVPVWFRVMPSAMGWGGLIFVAAEDERAFSEHLRNDPRLLEVVQQGRYDIEQTGIRPAVDDWPYLYLYSPHVPAPYYVLLGLPLLLVVVLGWRRTRTLASGWSREHTHFALLGAAFLLLETQNISKASLVLGSTWFVNAVMISGVLCLILAANALAWRFPRVSLRLVYGALAASCVALYFVDLSRFAGLPFAAKAPLVALVACSPMLFGGIAFIRSFSAVQHRDQALGANLFGALGGALLQVLTFVAGFQVLLLVVAVLYVAAGLLRPRQA